MSRLDELIAKFCPNGVKYRELKDILIIKNGKDYKNLTEGKYPVYGSGGIMTYVSSYVYDKPSVLIPRKGSIDKLYYVEEPFWNVDTIFYTEIDEEKVIPRYVYFCLQKEHLEQYNTAGGVPSLTQKVLNRVKLPVPPLEVQREIVHILDSFTLLTAELTAELTARKKQYEFYRDNLIKKEQHISEVKKLADVANIYDSLHQTPSYSNSGYSMVRVQDIKGGYVDEDKTLKVDESVWNLFTQKYTPQLNDIVVSRVGSYGNFALIPNDKCCLGQNVALIHPNINPKYLYHVLMSTMTKQWINNNVKGASQKSFSLADIKRVPVPVPKDNIQQRIAEVLDNFESICTNLSIGLPAEIEARQKQYEYYRDKLLSFKELPK